jgi:hypothetical protein
MSQIQPGDVLLAQDRREQETDRRMTVAKTEKKNNNNQNLWRHRKMNPTTAT